MDRRLLRRAQYGTVVGGVIAGLVAVFVSDVAHAMGIVAGAAWSALNLRVLEGLIAVSILPRDASRDIVQILIWGIAKLGVYGLAFWILIVRPFPAIGMVYGLTIMLVALVLAGLTARTAASQVKTPRGDDADA